MLKIALIAGTYDPKRCGVADYTQKLRTALSYCLIQSVVLTTRAAATDDESVQGVVENWRFTDWEDIGRSRKRSPEGSHLEIYQKVLVPS